MEAWTDPIETMQPTKLVMMTQDRTALNGDANATTIKEAGQDHEVEEETTTLLAAAEEEADLVVLQGDRTQ